MDITKMSITELKAVAFDIQQDIQRLQNNLQVVCANIEEKMKEEKPKK